MNFVIAYGSCTCIQATGSGREYSLQSQVVRWIARPETPLRQSLLWHDPLCLAAIYSAGKGKTDNSACYRTRCSAHLSPLGLLRTRRRMVQLHRRTPNSENIESRHTHLHKIHLFTFTFTLRLLSQPLVHDKIWGCCHTTLSSARLMTIRRAKQVQVHRLRHRLAKSPR